MSSKSDANFLGTFKANLPGHYRYQDRLYTHFDQQDIAPEHRGIFPVTTMCLGRQTGPRVR
ncbi:hypothetical protein [Glutamicibacter arilaitensis]|uniref:hypothetical protein n=1 Tax=Glutamicibacter arilaitensis TaxID=256701 RepID=UPI00384B239B